MAQTGFQAQPYQVDPRRGFQIARGVIETAIDGWIRSDIGGDEQRIHSRNTRYRSVAFRHLLLPVWIGAYRFHGRDFQIAVNARTGEVQGDRPYSAMKIGLLLVAILLTIRRVGLTQPQTIAITRPSCGPWQSSSRLWRG